MKWRVFKARCHDDNPNIHELCAYSPMKLMLIANLPLLHFILNLKKDTSSHPARTTSHGKPPNGICHAGNSSHRNYKGQKLQYLSTMNERPRQEWEIRYSKVTFQPLKSDALAAGLMKLFNTYCSLPMYKNHPGSQLL